MFILFFSNSSIVESRAGQEETTVSKLQTISMYLKAYFQSQKKIKCSEGLSLSNRQNNAEYSCKAREKLKIAKGQIRPCSVLISGKRTSKATQTNRVQQVQKTFSKYTPGVQVPFSCSAQWKSVPHLTTFKAFSQNNTSEISLSN